jgi:hypothetical protein
MAKVLVITTQPDTHLARVRPHLVGELLVFDPLRFPEYGLHYRLNQGQFLIQSGDASLHDVTAVWLRKPEYASSADWVTLGVDADNVDFSHSAYYACVTALYDLLRDRLWVSDYWNSRRASNKLLQLELAHALGFNVPETLVSNKPAEVQAFRSRVGDIVAKSLHADLVKVGGQYHPCYAVRISPDDKATFTGLPLTPMMFQQAIPKLLDLRVIVIGQEVFVCAIETQAGSDEPVDWRLSALRNQVTYASLTLPHIFTERARNLVQQLGLQFATLDLVQDLYGNLWFIELDPHGQWGFLEEETGMPLSTSLASLLNAGW